MPPTPRARRSDAPHPEAVAALRAAVEAGEMEPLPPLVPQSLAPAPRVKRKPARKPKPAPKPVKLEPVKCKHAGGHPRASPEATKAVLAALDAGGSVQAAAMEAGITWGTAAAIWKRERGTWPPPGLGAGSGKGGGRPATVTPAQAREAIKRRGKRTPGGDWETSIPAVAARLGVPVTALRRAIVKEQKRSEEE